MPKSLAFKKSDDVSLGIELEYQIIDPHSYSLISRAKELIRNIKRSKYNTRIKAEVTQSMIEINSSIHRSPNEMYQELLSLQDFLIEQEDELHIIFCGGGTHPFNKWSFQKIFPSPRYRNLAMKHRFLSKHATMFGLHIHIGCRDKENALYLTHAFTRYVPQLIAICASSPFYQGVDTGFNSARTSLFNIMPLSGVIPFFKTWDEFAKYFYLMKNEGIIHNMKDFYWDIRPKPEFGTVEIRVCDTPLTIKHAVNMAAYVQALAFYLLDKKPIEITETLYYFYSHNRFQASRYGYDGTFIHPTTFEHISIHDDILSTIKLIEHYANQLNSMYHLSSLMDDVIHKKNDSVILRQLVKQHASLVKVVAEQCKIWQTSR